MAKSKNYLSIALSNKSISVLEGRFNNKFEVINYGKVDLEDGIYKNGRVLNPDTMKEILLDLLKSTNIKSKEVLCTFDSTEVLTREIDSFDVKNKDDMDLIVSNEINQQLLINTQEYIIKYKKIESFFDNDTEKVKLFVAAMPLGQGKDLHEFFKICGFKPLILDLNLNSLENLISIVEDKPYSKGNIAIFETTYSNIKINILKNGKTRFSRNIDLVELEFTKEDFEKNEELEINGEVDLNLNFKMDKLTSDVGMIIKFYTSRSFENVISKAFVFGELAEYSELLKNLSEKTETNIEKMELSNNLNLENLTDSFKYYNNLGILLNSQK